VNIDLSQRNSLGVAVISDFCISDSTVLQRFDKLLFGASHHLNPLAFIFLGPFFSISNITCEDEMLKLK